MALARALAVEPQLLLLDEPFGALDAKVRKELRRWLRQLHEQMGLTSIFVTHDQEEALELADRVVVMDHGVIEQLGLPDEIYMNPASIFVSGFVGDNNSLPVIVQDGQVRFQDNVLSLPITAEGNGPARLDFRPHDVALGADAGSLLLTVTGVYRRGGDWRVEGTLPGETKVLEIDLPATGPAPAIGSQLGLTIRHARLFLEEQPEQGVLL